MPPDRIPQVENVHLIQKATDSQAGVTGYNFGYASVLGLALLFVLFSISYAFFG